MLKIFLNLFLMVYSIVLTFQGFNGADLRNVCTEAGLFAIRAERDYVIRGDFIKVMYFQVDKGI